MRLPTGKKNSMRTRELHEHPATEDAINAQLEHLVTDLESMIGDLRVLIDDQREGDSP